MLFGVDFCGRRVKKRRRSGTAGLRICTAILCLAAAAGLLFIAPQWLLVLLVLILTAVLFALVCAK